MIRREGSVEEDVQDPFERLRHCSCRTAPRCEGMDGAWECEIHQYVVGPCASHAADVIGTTPQTVRQTLRAPLAVTARTASRRLMGFSGYPGLRDRLAI